jgi:acetyl-CoA acetyltransferase
MKDATAVVGIGHTAFTKASGVSTLALAVEAIANAVEDAGLTMDDIDGLATHHVNDCAPLPEVAAALGLHNIGWYNDELGGGSKAPAVLAHAAMACLTGTARYAVFYRSLNGRSGARMSGSGGVRTLPSSHLQYQLPYGLVSPSQSYGLAARQHMLEFGTTHEHLGHIAVQQRAYAVDNPRALMREPITVDDYLASRWVADPFRLLDCCLETDGACAVVVTTSDRARDLRHMPVLLRGWASAIGPDGFVNSQGGKLTTSASADVAPRLFAMAGLGPEDVDVAEVYDAFTFSVLVQLEDYGFCPKGEGGPFVASGATAIDGSLPVNTHGGFLSEGYVHGLNHIYEAVSQLRGHAGVRQVPGCENVLSTGMPGYLSGITSAVILAKP